MENPKVPGMTKTPEELKTALELCVTVSTNDDAYICKKCPYLDEECAKCIPKDALAYTQWLEAENVRLGKRLEIANSSPFPQGMSQAEYFGLTEEDES